MMTREDYRFWSIVIDIFLLCVDLILIDHDILQLQTYKLQFYHMLQKISSPLSNYSFSVHSTHLQTLNTLYSIDLQQYLKIDMSWFSFLGNGQSQIKPEKPFTQQIQKIDDQVMQSMDSSSSLNIHHKKQPQAPRQMKSQSSNSSGFQQIIIQDSNSPHKNQNNQNQKPQITKSNVNLDHSDMNQTMNFYDDLTQSISENTYKYNKPSNFPQKDLMSFSYKSANDQSFSELSSCAKQMQEGFSNIKFSSHKMNHDSFSDLYLQTEKSKDLLRITQRPEDDSDMESDQQHKKMMKSKKAQDEHDQVLGLWDIPARKSSYTGSGNHQSITQTNLQAFSQIDDGFQEPTKDKMKEIEQIEMECSQDGQNNNEVTDFLDLDKSLIAPHIQPISNKKDNQKSKETTNKYPINTNPLNIIPKKSSDEPRISTQINNMSQSFVMTPVIQKPTKNTSSKQAKEIKNKPQALLPFEIHSKDYVHFIRYGKTEDRLLSQKLLQSLTEFFLIRNIMLPIFDIKLMQDVDDEMALERKEVKMSLFTFCINLYFNLLDKKYPQEMKRFFQSQQSLKNLKSQVGVGAKKQENSQILGNFHKKIFDYLKQKPYSKPQFLKKTLEAQLAFVSEYKQSWLQSWSDSDPNIQESVKQKQFSKRNSTQIQGVKQKEQFLLKKIAELEVLISFEKSEMYCEQKLKEKMEENIWKERKRKLIEDRNFFITHFYPSCFI